ncbi:MAG: energy-coupling factor transporter transmembrane component T [Oscillospiraceae bacterium]
MQIINKINPIVAFIYFLCVICLGMIITHPISFVTAYKLCQIKSFLFYIIVAIGISIINPFFNTKGETVIFTYISGRNYTLEALIYGAIMAMLFLTIINWFSCYNVIISSDKFMYIFGRIIPSTSLLLSMVLRFVPIYKNKILEISSARRCVGKGKFADTYKEKAQNGMIVVSALTSVVLENSIITANSMRSRGYGLNKRTSFSVYRFTVTDVCVLIIEILLFILVIVTSFFSKQQLCFIPKIILPKLNISFFVGIISYSLLLCIPIITILLEEIQWKILKSKI